MSTHASPSFSHCAWLVPAIASLAIACSPTVDVFGNESSGASSEGGESSGGSSSGGASSGGASSGGASTGGSTSTISPDTSTSTTSPTTTTTSMDNTSVTSGPTTVTTGPPPGPTVECNGSLCEVSSTAGNVCCFDQQALTEECVDAGNCQTGFENDLVAIQCQTPDDCDGGLICCAHREFGSQSPYDRTSCEAECNYPDLYLCDLANPDCPVYQDQNGNPLPSMCKQSQLLPLGYYICGFN